MDIRSFFGGSPPGRSTEKAKAKDTKPKRGRKVVHDEEDEDAEDVKPKGATPKKKQQPQPVLEETTASDYFGNGDRGGKVKRSDAGRPKTRGKPVADETSKKSANGGNVESNGRSTGRKKKDVSYAELDAEDFPDDNMLDDEVVENVKSEAMVGRRMGDDYAAGTDEDDDKPLLPKRSERSGKQTKLKDHEQDDFEPDEDVDMKDTNEDDDFVVPDEDEEIIANKPGKKMPALASKKRKSVALEDDDDDLEMEEAKPAKKRAAPAKKGAAAGKAKKEAPQDSAEVKAIFDSIPTIQAPEPPPKDGEKPKFQFGQHPSSTVPAAAVDMNELPQGEENCLAGLSFVFTGQLERLGREQGQTLVKQYGGRVTGVPSKKTSYVVLGEDAGPKKLETIKNFNLKVINEDGLFALIQKLPANGGDSVAAEKMAEKREKDESNIRKAAAEMEKQEKDTLAAQKAKAAVNLTGSKVVAQQSKGKETASGPDTRLWTVRYAPQQLAQICGNKGQVDKLANWLKHFPKNQRTNFKLAGADGSGVFRAVMIHGPPGIGKTTAAHLVAKLEGYDIVESNASDTRSKKLVESGLKGVLSTTSLMGYFSTSQANGIDASKKKLVLIMDEVDGMSAGDRGGVGALAAVCKKSQVPMILICNDRKLPKMKLFDFVTYDLAFRRPTTDQIRSRIMTIAFRENLKLPPNVVNALIEGSGADIRQVVNMISSAKLDAQTMSFEDGKDMSKAWEKHIVLKPWDMVTKILGGGLFNPASKSSLNDKQELYFNDHEFAPLMLQENYLGTNPQRTNKYNDNPKLKKLALLDFVAKAADSISDGDLVDRMIHGSQQQWSLMPTHAMLAFVRPASFVYGSLAGHGQTRFTAWLGKNSNQNKLLRMVKEVQGHMRLRVSADRHEIRQTYLPLLYEQLIKRLKVEGKDAVPEVIELMNSYFLTKDDWEAIHELGVGQADWERSENKIETQAKSTFTRLYNQQSHPMPFMKASQVLAPKRAPAKERPDIEEALEESADEAGDAAENADAEAKEEEDLDLSKDKYVKQPKKRKAGAAAGKAAASKKKKTAAASKDDDEEEEEEEEKPKKGKGKAAVKSKGKAKK
ncbi:DNA replication factor C complex subunit Rfc1 [Friedmanniomyces endolithicus]|uniref:Replication factor C subunit 1 n=1 Tax=Friedmanniomyces endolithicus TaxID=329885 RepID=A0AAN6K4T9_9PEZI|nr:DNA replication factor C complex subunit Rfc1 [Friedmanniomyces endolithicus]KAK0769103.1 DNA replication factor C complex subunit Rfc1 [Friedmanniomyces endolithicus]KAK0771249.1 DNA replication factor C complex subunit Rfc1 [Friedmanniomyces endolithicus]KAK0776859.1 DNA replication factor C complex subunit Rfc1 [Friedmanniomyces endolithicus]KAK0828330.1 DNA replication factor C complex subunit Rfc1 [Friedmanniomyces endolithicus]